MRKKDAENVVAAFEFSRKFDDHLKSFCNEVMLHQSGNRQSASTALINGLRISSLYSADEIVTAGFIAHELGLTLDQAVGQFIRLMHLIREERFKSLSFFERFKKDERDSRTLHRELAEFAAGSLAETREEIAEVFMGRVLGKLTEKLKS